MQLRFPFPDDSSGPDASRGFRLQAEETAPPAESSRGFRLQTEETARPPEASRGFRLQAEGSPAFTIHFVRMRQARRYVMRVRPDGDLRVTIPRGGSKAEAVRFAERHRARMLETRRPAAVDSALRAQAMAELPPQILALSARHGLTVNRVTIRNQRSRWGSCSARGHITLNFRLMLMPPAVREYILIHELMHLKQPNHSIRYWRLVEAACPGFRDAERWLKTHGSSLF